MSGMSLLFACTWKASLVLVLAAVLTLFLRRVSAAVRHMVWSVAIVGVLALGPLSYLGPQWHLPVSSRLIPPQSRPLLPVPQAMSTTARPIPIGAASDAAVTDRTSPISQPRPAADSSISAGFSLGQWLIALWMFGAIVLAAWFLAGSIGLWKTVRSAVAIDDERIAHLAETAAATLHIARARFRLRWTARPLTPMTWGFRRPFILLPATSSDWTDERLVQVLLHELAHIQRRDLLTQALSSVACIVYWFNPLQWWAARQMLVERERACDDVVLGGGATPSAYAHELLEVARSLGAGWTTSRVSTAMARRSQISGRLLAILDSGRSRSGVGRMGIVAASILAAAVLVPLSSIAFAPAIEPAPAVAVPVTPSTTPDAAPNDAVRTITLSGERWRDALRRHSAREMASIYTRDALIVPSGRAPLRGQREIERYWQGLMVFGLSEVDVQMVEVHPVGDMLCEVGRITSRTGSGVELGNASFMSLWKKEDGEWRIHREYVTP